MEGMDAFRMLGFILGLIQLKLIVHVQGLVYNLKITFNKKEKHQEIHNKLFQTNILERRAMHYVTEIMQQALRMQNYCTDCGAERMIEYHKHFFNHVT